MKIDIKKIYDKLHDFEDIDIRFTFNSYNDLVIIIFARQKITYKKFYSETTYSKDLLLDAIGFDYMFNEQFNAIVDLHNK